MLDCKLLAYSNAEHLSQIYTGFAVLARTGVINLSQQLLAPPKSQPKSRNCYLEAIVGTDTHLYYDLHDDQAIDREAANRVDYYFKRSPPPQASTPPGKARILPLGLNYAIYPDGIDWLELRRIIHGDRSPKAIARAMAKSHPYLASRLPFIPTVTNMAAPPALEQQPQVLFMARTWDPAQLTDLSREEAEDRQLINETRAKCIRLLRQEFGHRFRGGFQHSEYTRKHFGNLLVDDNRRSGKRQYIASLQHYPICISTTGLHQSNGWKLAEYVAFSKAIIAETLHSEVPGNFSPNNNYLAFATPEQCVDQAVRLFTDKPLRQSMMLNNQRYYSEYLRPDMMVKRTLDIALAGKATPVR